MGAGTSVAPTETPPAGTHTAARVTPTPVTSNKRKCKPDEEANPEATDMKKQKKHLESLFLRAKTLKTKMGAVEAAATDLLAIIPSQPGWAWAHNEVVQKDLYEV